MTVAALIILWSASLYLVILGGVALLSPARANSFLSAFAQTPLANLLEAALRLTVGLAFIIASPALDHPLQLRWIGLFLALTAVAFVIAPLAHRRFAARATKAVARFLPLLGIASILLGLSLALYLA